MPKADHDDLATQRAEQHAEELHQLYEREHARTLELEAAQRQLREAEAKYRALVERIPAVTYLDMIDPHDRQKVRELYVSPQVEEMLGYTPHEVTTNPDMWIRLIHPDDRERALQEDTEHYETGEPLDQEYRMVARDGRVVWVRDMAVIVPDDQGRPKYAQGVVFEVTEKKHDEEALRRYTERVEGLRQIDLAILAAETIEDLIGAALSRVQSLIPCERATVSLFDFEAQEVTVFVSVFTGETIYPQGSRIPLEQLGSYGEGIIQELRRGEVDVRSDLITEPEISPVLQAMLDRGIRSLITAPLLSQGDLIGSLSLTAPQPAAFSKEHSEIAGEVANQLAIAIRQARLRKELEEELAERKRAEEAVRRYAERVEGLRQIDLAILSAQTVEDLIQAAFSRLRELVPSRRATLWLMDFEAGIATVFVTSNSPDAALAPGVQHPIERWGSFGESVLKKLRGGDVYLRHDLATEPEPSPGLQALLEDGIHSLLVAPLLEQGELMGCVGLYADPPEAFTPEHVEIAREVANQLAIATRQTRLRQELEDELAERTRAQEETRRSEARKSAILESAMDCVITMDHEGKVVEFNPAAEETFGYSRDEAVGRPLADLIIPPSLRKAHREGMARYLETGEGPVLGKRLELTGMRADGTEFPVELAITRVDVPGPPLFTGYLRDITQRKQAEEELEKSRSLLAMGERMARIGTWELHLRTGNLSWSDELYRILGLEPDSIEPSFEALMARVHPDDRAFVTTTVEQGLASGQPFGYEARTLLEDGSVRLLQSENTTIMGADGTPQKIVGTTQDVTEQRQTEEELRRTVEALRETDEQRQQLLSRLVNAQEEERTRIAGDIHDDTIQVMTAVGIRLDLLRRATEDPKQLALLEQLDETVTMTVTRLRNLLFELRPPALDREGLAAALRTLLEQSKDKHGPSYALDDRLVHEPPTETRVILYRIAHETLSNVRKHSRATKVEILLENRDGGFLTRITDDGVGFSLDESDRYRPGHLGLVSLRERAELAGGWCRIESAPGSGTTVEVWVPESAQDEEVAS
ncbi:MAG TPA: PAS domain S-box protein [Actinomycetota bacterium]|nr:PAS domain S-box protein [Actinomycetota bacterium]